MTTANIGITLNKKKSVGASITVLVAGVLTWFLLGTFVPESDAQDAAESLGYTDVHVLNRSYALPFTGCGKGDIIKWTVSGVNSTGKHTTFTVCAGLFKGATPRF